MLAVVALLVGLATGMAGPAGEHASAASGVDIAAAHRSFSAPAAALAKAATATARSTRTAPSWPAAVLPALAALALAGPAGRARQRVGTRRGTPALLAAASRAPPA